MEATPDPLDVIRALMLAWRTRDIDGALEFISADVVWCEDPSGAGFVDLQPVYHGHDGLRVWYRQVREVWRAVWPELVELVLGTEGRVACGYRLHARTTDADAEIVSPVTYDVYTVHEGLVTERALIGSRQGALERAGAPSA